MTNNESAHSKSTAQRLIRNAIVFVDTKFLKEYTPKKAEYKALFQHCRDGLIALCASHIVVEEWRTQKVSHAHKTFQSLAGGMTELFGTNIIVRKILGDVNPYIGFPDEITIGRISKEVIATFLSDNNIQELELTEEHMQSAWDSYFHGKPPYDRPKNRTHIPDSWIYEAAREAIANPKNQTFQNRFCICEDDNLRTALKNLEWTPITLVELLGRIQEEIQALPSETPGPAAEQETVVPVMTVGPQQPTEAISLVTVALPRTLAAATESSQAASVEQQEIVGGAATNATGTTAATIAQENSLEAIFPLMITDEVKEICIWILGAIHWHKGPSKDRLNETLALRGFNKKLIEAAIIILAQKSLKLIQDTGNHYIPVNKPICKQAADRIEADFIKILGLG